MPQLNIVLGSLLSLCCSTVSEVELDATEDLIVDFVAKFAEKTKERRVSLVPQGAVFTSAMLESNGRETLHDVCRLFGHGAGHCDANVSIVRCKG